MSATSPMGGGVAHLQCLHCGHFAKSHAHLLTHLADNHPTSLDDVPVGRLGNILMYQAEPRLFHCAPCFFTSRDFGKVFQHVIAKHCDYGAEKEDGGVERAVKEEEVEPANERKRVEPENKVKAPRTENSNQQPNVPGSDIPHTVQRDDDSVSTSFKETVSRLDSGKKRNLTPEVDGQSDPLLETRDPLLEKSDPLLETTDPKRKTSDSKLKTSDPLLEKSDLLLETTDPKLETTDPKLETSDPLLEKSDPLLETNDPKLKTSDPKLETSDPLLEKSDPLLETTDPLLETNDPKLETSDPKLKTSDPLLKTSDPKLETSDPKLETSDPKLETSDPKLKTSDPKLETSDPKLETSDPLLEKSDPLLETTDPKLETSDPKLETSDPLLEKSDPLLETTDPKLETSDPKLETSDPKLETSDPKLETSDPKLETSDPVLNSDGKSNQSFNRDTKNILAFDGATYRCLICGWKNKIKAFGVNHVIRNHDIPRMYATHAIRGEVTTPEDEDVVGLSAEMLKEEIEATTKVVTFNAGRFNCLVCGWKTKLKGFAISHVIRFHDVELRYTCKDCGRRFFLPSRLQQHVRAEHRPGRYGCPFCSFRTHVLGGFKRHCSRCCAREGAEPGPGVEPGQGVEPVERRVGRKRRRTAKMMEAEDAEDED